MATAVETLCRDIFPAEVATPNGTVRKNVRVFVTSERMIVWAAPFGTPEVVFDMPLTEPGSLEPSRMLSRQDTLTVDTMSGRYHVNRGRGCGCTGPSRVLKALGAPVEWPA